MRPQIRIPLLDHDLGDLRGFGLDAQTELEMVVPCRTVLECSVPVVVPDI